MAVSTAPEPRVQSPTGRFLTTLFVLILPPAGAVAALATIIMGRVQPVHVALLVGMFLVSGLGITVGYHRLLTHRAFETNGVIKLILWIMGSMAVEGATCAWAANHVKHHVNADKPGDPHSPLEGFFHAHWGWLSSFAEIDTERYAAWTLQDPIAVFVSKTFGLWVTLGYVIPFLIAGWEGLIWGGLFRQFCVQNTTFAVNSVCHKWGKRPFNTGDQSTNNWVVGLLGLGEGWHNNHHAFPISAYHGLKWWEFDLSGEIIRILEALNLAWNVRRPDIRQIQMKLFEPTAATLYTARVTTVGS